MNNREIFKRNFKRRLEMSGMSQVDLAKSLSVNRSTVSAWITGRGYPRADAVQKIAMILGCEMSDLVIDDEKQETDEERLLQIFRSLNVTGKAKLFERAEELSVLYGGKSDTFPTRTVRNG